MLEWKCMTARWWRTFLPRENLQYWVNQQPCNFTLWGCWTRPRWTESEVSLSFAFFSTSWPITCTHEKPIDFVIRHSHFIEFQYKKTFSRRPDAVQHICCAPVIRKWHLQCKTFMYPVLLKSDDLLDRWSYKLNAKEARRQAVVDRQIGKLICLFGIEW